MGNTKKPLVDGELVLNANHIIFCGILKCEDSMIEMFSVCLQSSHVHDYPFEIKINISVSDTIKEIKCLCSCPAGEGGKCKHIFASLLYINRKGMNNLETLSCTDLKQKWGKLSLNVLQEYKTATKIIDLCHYDFIIKQEHENYSHLNEYFFNTLLAGNEDSEAYFHFSKSRNTNCSSAYDTELFAQQLASQKLIISKLLNINLPQVIPQLFFITTECKIFFENNISITVEGAHSLCLSSFQQNNDIWLTNRKIRITGSVCYELYTYTKNKNANWNSKIKNVFFNNFKGNSNTRHGNINEPKARLVYEQEFGKKVIQLGLFVHPQAPWLGFSPDGILSESSCLIEIKCPMGGKKLTAEETVKNLKYFKEENPGNYTLKENHKYYAQIQLGMALLNLEKCHFIVYSSMDNTIFVKEIFPNNSFMVEMMPRLQSAYSSIILPYFVANL